MIFIKHEHYAQRNTWNRRKRIVADDNSDTEHNELCSASWKLSTCNNFYDYLVHIYEHYWIATPEQTKEVATKSSENLEQT